jgi:hypothetical protein
VDHINRSPHFVVYSDGRVAIGQLSSKSVTIQFTLSLSLLEGDANCSAAHCSLGWAARTEHAVTFAVHDVDSWLPDILSGSESRDRWLRGVAVDKKMSFGIAATTPVSGGLDRQCLVFTTLGHKIA